ncbi:TolC family protein [bacterium]|nr:TolC family protein [bacterium]
MRTVLKHVSVVLLITVIMMPALLPAQETMVLTLAESVGMALEKNPQLQIARKNAAKARAGIGEAYAALLPAVDANANFQHAWEIQTNTIPNFLKPMLAPLAPVIPEFADMPDFVQLSFGLENTFTYGLRLTQPLYLGGAGIAGVKIAYAAADASESNLETTRQNIIYQTVNTFYGCILARELVDVQSMAVEQAQANLDVVLKKYDAGSASGFEKMRAQVELANLQPQLISARNGYRSARTGLRTILGIREDVEIGVQGSLTFTGDDFADSELQEIQRKALENRPELQALQAQKRMAAKGMTIARSQFLPKLFFSTDYSFLAMKNDPNFSRDDFSKGFTSAVSLQIPLFHGLKNHRAFQKARLDYKIVLDSERQLRDGVFAEVEIAYNTFREAREKYLSAEESIELAEEALRLANLTYQEGGGTQLDVMSSQLALTRARLNHVSALYEYQMSRYALRKVTGTLKGILE